MVVIAVAGGAGCLGRTIVEELVGQGKHKVIVLSRKRPAEGQVMGAPAIEVDYNDVDSMQRVLEEHKVHTVISAIMILKEKAASDMQVNLIKAAGKSRTTKRFMPSEYSIDNQPSIVHIAPNVQWFLDAIDALKETDLEYTRLLLGYFIDFYGMPHVKTHLFPFKYALDVEAKEATLSGTGDEPVSMIYSVDFAKLVVAALDLEVWKETYSVIGETTTFNKMLRKAEQLLVGLPL
ncbi:hypothetical protein N0V84_012175 [Fusarium piperis]|uniref:NAD(P)-binding domain-containing protein n=1 Tax=Fusarium piperis TaxID=1435070 RepID=A0A9W8TAQ7_9HYPO|nr:hypothetical protein N0V84_012175 [Fusarium piperis]